MFEGEVVVAKRFEQVVTELAVSRRLDKLERLTGFTAKDDDKMLQAEDRSRSQELGRG